MNASFFDVRWFKKSVVWAALACMCAAYFAFSSGSNSGVSSGTHSDAPSSVQLNQAQVRLLASSAQQLSLATATEQGKQSASTAVAKAGDWQTVSLPDPWSAYSPQRSGVYEYQLKFSSTPATLGAPQAVYIPRLGNRYQVWFNQRLVSSRGDLADASIDLSHQPYLVTLAASDWVAGENVLTLRIGGEESRFAGLSTVWIGDAAALGQKLQQRTLWQTLLSWVIIFISLSVGVLAWVVAYYSNIRYLWVFGLGAVAWGVRTGFLVTSAVFTDYRVFLFVFDALFALAVVCFVFTAARVVKLKSKALNMAVRGYVIAAPILSALFALGVPGARTVLMALMLGLVVLMAYLYVQNLRRGGSQHSTMLQLAFVMAILFGVYDFVVILKMKVGYELFSLSKFSFVLTALALASLFGSRLSRINAQLRLSHQKINARLVAAQKRLNQEFAVRAQQERNEVLMQERWRLMQDMHDGLGGQLVSLHQAVGSPNASPAALTRQVKFALDSLRMTVNALGQNHTNIAFMLGSIRERLEFLCDQYGKTLSWQLRDIPDLAQIDAAKINELEKIVLELFTNIAKHSDATQVTVSAGYEPNQSVWLKVQENGSGYALACAGSAPEHEPAGKGLKGLKQRAVNIGAQLEFAKQGTEVTLTLAVA